MDKNHTGEAHVPGALFQTPKASERVRRDEWTAGGVLYLLDVYESKWFLRNRAKLKGSDWEDIARQVSTHSAGANSLKTPNQCKNKIESMKKRYRAESVIASQPSLSSTWLFYTRMDSLVKGTTSSLALSKPNNNIDLQAPPKVDLDAEVDVNLRGSNHDDGSNSLPVNPDMNATPLDSRIGGNKSKRLDTNMGSHSSASSSKDRDAPHAIEGNGNSPKRRNVLDNGVAESIRFLAESILKIEHARIEMHKDSERMRVEAEVKRAEMELKRTEIISKTQLQIAKIFCKRLHGRSDKRGSSSLSAEYDTPPSMDEMDE